MSEMKITEDDICVQFGAGNEAFARCKNFDVSPHLRLQRLPLIGRFLYGGCIFESVVVHGDIVQGLGLSPNTVKELFVSYISEHLSFDDELTTSKHHAKCLNYRDVSEWLLQIYNFMWMPIEQN